MKVILCGYNWTGAKALESLLNRGCEVYVYTHSTKNGASDLEGLCLKKNIDYSLDKISVQNLPFHPDIICSIYYRYIIKADVIQQVNGKIFNLHPSLLPKYRGCSSLTWAMINGENECGFTYHYIDAGCDTGNILLQKSIKIEDFDTQNTLYNRVMFEAMNSFDEAFTKVVSNEEGVVQSEGKLYKRGCPMNGEVSLNSNLEYADQFIRAMNNPPYPPAICDGKEIYTIKEFMNLKNEKLEKRDACNNSSTGRF